MIPPVDMDPAGDVGKLGTILNVREFTFEKEVTVMAPNASESERNNLENLLEAGLALNVFYKVIRHFYLLGKKTLNIYIIMQIHMIVWVDFLHGILMEMEDLENIVLMFLQWI